MVTSTGHDSRQAEHYFKPDVAALRDEIDTLIERLITQLVEKNYIGAEIAPVIIKVSYVKRRYRSPFHIITHENLFTWPLSNIIYDGYYYTQDYVLTQRGDIAYFSRYGYKDAEGRNIEIKSSARNQRVTGWMVIAIDTIPTNDLPGLIKALNGLVKRL